MRPCVTRSGGTTAVGMKNAAPYSGVDPHAEALIKRVQEIGRARHVEHPYEADGHGLAPDQGDGGGDREHRGPEVPERRGRGRPSWEGG